MAVVKKVYGARPPASRVLVRVQEVEGKHVKSTQSFAIYDRDVDDVVQLVEEALDNHFGEENEYTGEEEKTPVARVKRRKR